MKAELFDTHCHLDREEFTADFDQILKSAQDLGVRTFVVPGCGYFNWDSIEQLSLKSAGIYFALGMHPYFLNQHKTEHLEILEKRLKQKHPKCVAVGECGLDFYFSRDNASFQKLLLTEQIRLANDFNLPLILHCRKAHQDLIKLLKQHKPQGGGVIHGFTGSYQQAMDYINLGFYIGVGGSITYERAVKTRKAIASLPLSSLVLETDAPDMPVSGFQGEPNRPERILHILNVLNLLRNEGEQTIANMVSVNSKRLFNLCE